MTYCDTDDSHDDPDTPGLTYFGMEDKRQGIVHVIGPEQAGVCCGLHSIVKLHDLTFIK